MGGAPGASHNLAMLTLSHPSGDAYMWGAPRRAGL